MKKIVIALVLFAACGIGYGQDSIRIWKQNGVMTFVKRGVFKSYADSIHYYQYASRDVAARISYDFSANRDTVHFITPPHKIIVGNTSYTSLFLNGTWVLLMDPTPYNGPTNK